MIDLTLLFFLDSEKMEFVTNFNKPENDNRKRRTSRGSKSSDVNPELVKTAVYVKHTFMVKLVHFSPIEAS